MLGGIITALRNAVRTLRRDPGFTLTAVLTLALAIGANSAIFTLCNVLIFANLPVPHPERLVEISTISPKGIKSGFSIPAFQEIQRQTRAFDAVFAWQGGGLENLEMNGIPFAGSVDEVAGDYYSTIGIRPSLGRFITPGDIGMESYAPSRVAVIGYRAWQERYHGDPGVLGKPVLLNGKPFTIVGVHPASYPGLIRETEADATVPLSAYLADAKQFYERKSGHFTVIGRLRDGVGLETAQAQFDAIWPSIRAATAPESGEAREMFLARHAQITPVANGIS
jgi:hypothetical protein